MFHDIKDNKDNTDNSQTICIIEKMHLMNVFIKNLFAERTKINSNNNLCLIIIINVLSLSLKNVTSKYKYN